LLPFKSGHPVVQFMDENKVAAALWGAASQSAAPLATAAHQAFWKAFASKQMNDGKYTRGYFRHVWTAVKPTGSGEYKATYVGLKQTWTLVPTLVDYLDALVCASPQLASKLSVSTAPLSFPWSKPICKK